MKEKAKDLVEKFMRGFFKIENRSITINEAKQCALICVDEKIETLRDICELKNGMSKQELVYSAELMGIKNEINNL